MQASARPPPSLQDMNHFSSLRPGPASVSGSAPLPSTSTSATNLPTVPPVTANGTSFAPATPGGTTPFPPGFASASQPRQQQFNHQWGNSTSQNNIAAESDVFSQSQLMAIIQELFTGLRTCRNKLDQLQLIFSLTIKYIN
ncbi:hypothetical protein DMENIID0001_156460 [Sergentomyia squamirostris]